MRRVHRSEQLLLAEKFVIVLLGLRIEARVVIWVEGLRIGRGAQDRFVQAADSTAAGVPVPAVIASFRICVTVADESGSARTLWRKHRVKGEQPVPAALLEVGIYRQWFNFGASNQVVARVVADIDIVDYLLLLARTDILACTVKVSQIVIVALDRPEHVVPDDLLGDEWIVRVDQRERLPGDVTHETTMVIGKTNLRRVLLGRVLIRRRPLDSLSRYYVHLHSMLHHIVDARRYQVLDLGRVLGRDDVAGFDASTRCSNCHRRRQHGNSHAEQSLPNYSMKHYPNLLKMWGHRLLNKSRKIWFPCSLSFYVSLRGTGTVMPQIE